MRKSLWIILLIAALPFRLSGQKELYYYGSNTKPVEQLSQAMEYAEVNKKSERKYVIRTYNKLKDKWVLVNIEKIRDRGDGNQVVFYNKGTFFPRRFYREMEKGASGEYHFRESTPGILLRTGTSSRYLPLHLEGVVTRYHSNGKVKSISLYRDNQLLFNENWLSDGSKYIDSLFYSVDKEPEYQMGNNFFRSFLFQKLADSKLDLTQIEDKVVIGWVVMKTGELEGVIALQGKSRELNELLVSAISELPGYWTPAELNGKKVRYFMSIPLNFIQREASFQDVELSSGMLYYNRY